MSCIESKNGKDKLASRYLRNGESEVQRRRVVYNLVGLISVFIGMEVTVYDFQMRIARGPT